MIDFRQVASLVSFIKDCDGINDKQLLAAKVKEHFSLVVDRKIYYCDNGTLESNRKIQRQKWVICEIKPNKHQRGNVFIAL